MAIGGMFWLHIKCFLIVACVLFDSGSDLGCVFGRG